MPHPPVVKSPLSTPAPKPPGRAHQRHFVPTYLRYPSDHHGVETCSPAHADAHPALVRSLSNQKVGMPPFPTSSILLIRCFGRETKKYKVHGANGPSRLKCNREKPCQNCVTRNQQGGCHFQGPASHGPPLPAANAACIMRQRIDRLEALVKRLVADSSSQSSVSSPEIAADRRVGAGKTVMDGNHSVYVGDGDWRVVLEEVIFLFQRELLSRVDLSGVCLLDQRAQGGLPRS